MKRLKLKKSILKTIYVMAVAALFISVILVGGILKTGLIYRNDNKYVINPITDTAIPVLNLTNKEILKPYVGENVAISKYFYNKDDSVDNQEKSLIYYQNTYMQNTGLLYTSNESFEVIAVLDGKVTNIKEDNILGNVIEVAHSDDLLTIYYCLSDIQINVGDEIIQGDLIGMSGSNNLNQKYKNSLLFEVYYNNDLIDPIKFFEMNIDDLKTN